MEKAAKVQPSITTEFTAVAVLKGMRDALGVSQETFGSLVGVKRQQISCYENEQHTPGMTTVQDMANRAGFRLVVTIEPVLPSEP